MAVLQERATPRIGGQRDRLRVRRPRLALAPLPQLGQQVGTQRPRRLEPAYGVGVRLRRDPVEDGEPGWCPLHTCRGRGEGDLRSEGRRGRDEGPVQPQQRDVVGTAGAGTVAVSRLDRRLQLEASESASTRRRVQDTLENAVYAGPPRSGVAARLPRPTETCPRAILPLRPWIASQTQQNTVGNAARQSLARGDSPPVAAWCSA